MSLTKSGIIKSAYENLGIPKKDCVRVIENVFAIIKEELEKGNPVKISGFGKLTVKAENKRRSRNPKTGKELIIEMNGKIVMDKPSPVLTELDVLNIFKKYIEQDRPSAAVYGITDSVPGNCHAYALPQKDCWYVLCSAHSYQANMICSSRIIAISRTTGEVVYDGSANDEG
jgi:integration host factor subunit alpha